MKPYLAQISSIIMVTLGLSSCFDPPFYPDEPVIAYKSLVYINYPDGANGARDSLILSFEFEDGDGDVGLGDNFTFYPYHSYDLVIDSNGDSVTYEDDAEPPFYAVDPAGNRRRLEGFTEKPKYNVCDYIIGKTGSVSQDTTWIVKNEFNKNFHIDFYRKRNGEYSRIDFGSILGEDQCEYLTYDARIPIFDEEGQGSSMSGTIHYDLKGSGWEFAFSTDTFRLEFYIYDRALHKSNVVVTPDLTLLGIMENRN